MNEIKKLRQTTGLSQSQFAKKYGIPVRTLQKWEQQQADPLSYLYFYLQTAIGFDNYVDVSRFFQKTSLPFKKTISGTFKNVRKIHPIQQKNIETIVNALKEYEVVKKIVVFGSSVTHKCTYDSDIDLYVELSKDMNVKTYDISCPVDYWTNFSVPQTMLEEINNKGVVVYDR